MALFARSGASGVRSRPGASDPPDALTALLATAANTEAYAGHFQKAHQISKAAAEIMARDGNHRIGRPVVNAA